MKSDWGLSLSEFLEAARGEAPADLVFRNARVVNVLTGEIHEETVGIKGDRILGFGEYRAGRPEDEIYLQGAFLAPALWDAHLHVDDMTRRPPSRVSPGMARRPP
jgi:adenine deaminase